MAQALAAGLAQQRVGESVDRGVDVLLLGVLKQTPLEAGLDQHELDLDQLGLDQLGDERPVARRIETIDLLLVAAAAAAAVADHGVGQHRLTLSVGGVEREIDVASRRVGLAVADRTAESAPDVPDLEGASRVQFGDAHRELLDQGHELVGPEVQVALPVRRDDSVARPLHGQLGALEQVSVVGVADRT